ncbi:MAG TPA: hypothetical protein VL527_19380 [Dongiaceae bacterium]|jgi:hypothetical protein|nr:hypothetical protein [Dongiaceae bacterium]
MSADKDLSAAYESWRGLAETEGEAIQKRDWKLVSACQNALRELQNRIVVLTDQARSEWLQLGLDVSARERAFRAVISDLIAIERHNSTLLGVMQEAALVQINDLERSGANLKRIRRSYTSTRSAVWSSFS